MTKQVMVKAWVIARAAVKRFGGKVREYLSQALRQAWASAKRGEKGMQVHTWTTAKGAVVELHAEHITSSSRTTDWGDVIVTPENTVIVSKVVVNGVAYSGSGAWRMTVNGAVVLDLGVQLVSGKKVKITVALPADVNKAVWGAYDAIKAAKDAKQAAYDKKQAEERKARMARPGWDEKSGSYAWGDR